MGVLSWILIGVIISILTLMIEAYINRRHIPATFIWGVIGAVVGGAFGTFVGFGKVEGMHFMIAVWAYVGSVLFLTIYREVERS